MARPNRPGHERIAVFAAASGMIRKRSASGMAHDIASRVVAEAIAFLELDRSEPLIAMLAQVQLQSDSPITVLALCPEIDVISQVLAMRVERYAARDCRQSSVAEREAETKEIAAALTLKLATRYSRYLQNSSQKLGKREAKDGTLAGNETS